MVRLAGMQMTNVVVTLSSKPVERELDLQKKIEAKSPPSWALSAARVSKFDVQYWCEEPSIAKWAPSVMMLTADEVIYAERGLVRKAVHRIPRHRVMSVMYSQGMIWDSIALNTAGGDIFDQNFKVGRGTKQQARDLVDELQKVATNEQ